MTAAAEPIVRAKPVISVVRAFVNINRGFLGGKETGINDGEFVKWIQRQTDNRPPDPWCASMQSKAGYMLLGNEWPVPLSASCKAIGDWAERNGILIDTPQVGALMLFWHEKDSRGARFAHIACVDSVISATKVVTVEGNTTEPKGSSDLAKSRDGNGCYSKTRDVQPKDRFVPWWLALPTNKTS